jgi:hypothetical protein
MNERGQLFIVARRKSGYDRGAHFAAVAISTVAPGAAALEHLSSPIILADEQCHERQADHGSQGDQS